MLVVNVREVHSVVLTLGIDLQLYNTDRNTWSLEAHFN
jgi:hypothetical protein